VGSEKLEVGIVLELKQKGKPRIERWGVEGWK